MGMADLWETWRSPVGERIGSFTIVTTQPNELCAELHNRMPVVLKPDTWPAWLGEQPATVRDLKAMLAPYPSDDMIRWPVGARVGNVKNIDPSLIEPIAAAGSDKLWKSDGWAWTIARPCCLLFEGDRIPPMPIVCA